MNQSKRIFLLMMFLVGICLQMQAQKTIIKGTVLDDDGEPAISVVIRDRDENGGIYGITDYNGHFRIKADPVASLYFSGLTYLPKVVKLKGKTSINVVLSFQSQKLDEVVVVARRMADKMIPEQTDVEVRGNRYIIRPKIKIPGEMFKPNTRIVVQPILENLTRGSRQLFRPAVVTGKQYAVMLERMMEFDTRKDPLSPYYQKSTRIGTDEVMAYTDSLPVVRPDDECRCDIYMYLVDYRRVVYKDTVAIAKGTVNPMRFFEYKIEAASLTDDRYLPQQEKQMRGEKGEVSLTFVENRAKIDKSDPNNTIELTKIQQRLMEIQNRPDTEFRSFAITGVSSPEGRYEGNLALARKRTVVAKNLILGCLRRATAEALRDSIRTGARVETWETIAGWMRRDSLAADGLETIILAHPGDRDRQFREIRSLPDYLPVIRPYLPRARRVEFSFTYLMLRLLRDDEIQCMYRENYTKLTRFEFWRMCRIEKNNSVKEEVCRRALEVYPDFMAVANELAALLINRGKPDVRVLEPFVNEKAPREILNNQIAALLAHREFLRADSVAGLMPEHPQTEEIRAVAHAMNGDYEEAYHRFAPQGDLNEVVLLLAMRHNEEAWQKAKALPDDDARNNYLRAICANRMDLVAEAAAFLKRAVTQDPELMNVARIDGDVTDLVEYMNRQGKERKQEGKQKR